MRTPDLEIIVGWVLTDGAQDLGCARLGSAARGPVSELASESWESPRT